MKTTVVGMIAVAGLACGAMAGPSPAARTNAKGPANAGRIVTKHAGSLMGPDGPGINENFDAYANGSTIAGQGGWEVWYTGGVDGTVSNEQAASAPHSLRLAAFSDIVHRFTIDDGKWVYKAKVYVPSSTPPGTGGFIILMNQYGGPDNWSVQLACNDTTNSANTVPFMIESQFDGGILPLVTDSWKEVRCEIDLVADQVTNFYDGQMLGTPHLWTDNAFASGPGITSIASTDLFSNGISPMYLDDVSLAPVVACYADCNGDGALTVADFGCFQTKFVAGDPYADCNGDGVRTVADFGCFQTKFVAGCP